ncbi:MAG: PAS domain S-box protein [Desulfovibrio sp.]|nr:MAG: PAS domain S-box protein [Desulfovibrio sp.]
MNHDLNQDLTQARARIRELELMLEQSSLDTKLLAVQGMSPVVIYTGSARGGFTPAYLSPNAREHLGYPAEDFLSDPRFWEQHIHPQDRERVAEGREFGPSRARCSMEYRFLHASGEYRWFRDEFLVLCDARGEPQEYVGTLNDVTVAKDLERRSSELEAANELLNREVSEHQMAREALRVSEERYRKLFENASEGILVAEVKSKRFRFANPAICRMLGYSTEELLGLGVKDIHPKQDLHDVLRTFDRQARGEMRTAHNIPCLCKDGRIIHTNVSTTSMAFNGMMCNVGFFTDISEHRKTLEALREREEIYRLLVENQNDLVVKVDVEGRFLFVSPSYLDLFGKSEDELLGKAFMPLVHEEDRDSTARAMEALFKPPHKAYMEQRAMTKQGWRWLAWSDTAVLDDSGEVAAIVGVGRDITLRKHFEATLERRVDELSALYALGMDVLSSLSADEVKDKALERIFQIVEPDMAFLYMIDNHKMVLDRHRGLGESPHFKAQWGQGVGECLCGMAVTEQAGVYSLDIHTDARCTLDACKETGIRSFTAIPLLVGRECLGVLGMASCQERNFSEQAAFLEALVGIAASALQNALLHDKLAGSMQDLEKARDELDERVRDRTLELKLANERLVEMDRAKTSFMNTISHDLRTPLTSVLGFAKMIGKDFSALRGDGGGLDTAGTAKADRIEGNLAIIEQEGKRLTRLLNDFLDLSKIESGHYEWQDREIAVKDLVDDAVAAMGGELALKPKVSLHVEIVQDLPQVKADPDRLFQVLSNLLSNALKFTSQGSITVSVTLQPANLNVCVEDTGIGIAEADQPGLFIPFVQAKSDTLDKELDEQPKGSGLGLAICKQIVEHYQGRIWVESEPGKGSAFCFTLPVGGK